MAMALRTQRPETAMAEAYIAVKDNPVVALQVPLAAVKENPVALRSLERKKSCSCFAAPLLE